MPQPEPRPDEETEPEWVERCMSDPTMKEEYPGEEDEKVASQRYAICKGKWPDSEESSNE